MSDTGKDVQMTQLDRIEAMLQEVLRGIRPVGLGGPALFAPPLPHLQDRAPNRASLLHYGQPPVDQDEKS